MELLCLPICSQKFKHAGGTSYVRGTRMEFYNLFKKTDGELRFPNLQRLSLASHWHVSMESEIVAIKQLDLPKMCPRLTHLELRDTGTSYTEVEQVMSPVDESHELNKSNSPLQVELNRQDRDDGEYRHEYLNFLKEIYPQINKVKIIRWGQDDCSEVCKIFSNLQSLEYLEINVLGGSKAQHFHLDALLRGINIEEARLGTNACVVAIRPSILNAKSLKELKITQHGARKALSQNWVTEITENIPTRSARNLKVVFEGSAGLYNGLNRLGALPSCTPCAGVTAQ